jgi:ssDNA-binding Zn-finger/Zn-ribbon topoisomerase 1
LIGPGTRGTETDPLELLAEVVEEQAEQWLSPFVSGFRVSLRRLTGYEGERRIKVCYSFSVRDAPPSTAAGQEIHERDRFRSVDLCFVIRNESRAEVSLVVYDGTRQNVLFTKETQQQFENHAFSVSVPEGAFTDARDHLTTTVGTGYGGRGRGVDCQRLRFTYAFAATASLTDAGNGDHELSVRLNDLEGSFTDSENRIIPVNEQNRICRFRGVVDGRRKGWSIGQLHEVQSVLGVTGYDFLIRSTQHGIAGIRPINCAYDLSTVNEGEIRFRDYAIVPERGRTIRQSTQRLPDFLMSVLSQFGDSLGLTADSSRVLANALADALRPLIDDSEFLYTFQEDCTCKVLECLVENASPASAVPMSVQTAGGKTLGFLIPISIYALSRALSNGVKAMLFYPTKALINDQSDLIVRLLWRLNNALNVAGVSRSITFGILHGDIRDKKSVSRSLARSGQTEITETLRLKCPACTSQLTIQYTRVGERGVSETVSCSGSEDSACPLHTSSENIRSFNSMLRCTEESVYSNPPDLLVCTPDMINYRLFFDPSEQAIFGRQIKRCPSCSYSTADLAERHACPQCRGALEGPLEFAAPRVFVFDEAHQLRGSFGSQVSHVTSRLEEAVKAVTGNSDYRPVYVFSSATLARPSSFARSFFGMTVPTKALVKADYLRESSTVQRIHLFMVPKGYSPEATLVQTVKAIFQQFPLRDRYPNILIFVNSLSESNELIHLLKHYRTSFMDRNSSLTTPAIDGHSTDYGSTQRVQVEDDFTRGITNVLVATSTLQVGVDFNRIDALIVYGAPFYLSDYVQRIGRAGRKHAALIVNILPNKPIDFFFFGNYPLITDLEVRDRALDAEAIGISRDNERVRNRSIVRALLDYLCTRSDSPRYFKGGSPRATDSLLHALFASDAADRGAQVLLEQVANRQNVNTELLAYIERAIRAHTTELELRSVFRTIDDVLAMMSTSGIRSLRDLFSNRQLGFLDSIYAGHLRQNDHLVKVEHPDLQPLVRAYERSSEETTRDRTLSIAIGDYGPGQITSYRSIFFIVDNIESEPTMSGQVRHALYRRQSLARRDDL